MSVEEKTSILFLSPCFCSIQYSEKSDLLYCFFFLKKGAIQTKYKRAGFFICKLLDPTVLSKILFCNPFVSVIYQMCVSSFIGIAKDLTKNYSIHIQGWASVLFKRTLRSFHSFPFFIKECSVLSVLFRSFEKNGTFFFCSFCLHKSYKPNLT